jgi:hypothetical protein
MFKLSAVLFAVFMGFFMSLAMTICLSFYMTGFNNSLLTKFFQLWPIAYPIAIISIIIYRPLSLWIAGKALTKLSSKNSKE